MSRSSVTALADEVYAAWPALDTGTTRDGSLWVRVMPHTLLQFVHWAQNAGFVRYLDCSVVDEPGRPDRFDVQYLLYSMQRSLWLRIKCRTTAELPTLTARYPAANWYEREAFDLFGVVFTGHPDLRRLLLPDDFVGHPLRRDHALGSEPIDFTVTREIYGT